MRPMNEGDPTSRGRHWMAGGIIVLAALAVYHNTFRVPFVFDDFPSVVDNASIRHLWPLGPVLSPPGNGAGVTARPLVNLSLAVNYTLGGTDVRGYHVFNLVVHALNGLLLFGLLRRTFASPGLGARLGARLGRDAWALSLAVAVLWTVHPLQTETVTCVVQRTESLVALFYLLTLYAFVRATQTPAAIRWPALSIGACLLGMATKEVIVTAPVVVLLYDRTFLAGTFRHAWSRHWRVYLGLAATWLLLGWLLVGAGGSRASAAGFGLGVGVWNYALTQCHAIALYLKLAAWPHPLVVDYGMVIAQRLAQVWPQALLILALLAGTVVALRRWPALGFVGAWFFVILAPSSSFVPLVTQTMAEHRMYLPLAAVIAFVVAALHTWIGRSTFVVCALLAVGLGLATVRRNFDYRSEIALWTDAVEKRPANPRAHYSLGRVLIEAGRIDEGLRHDEEAVRLQPNYAEAINNVGIAMFSVGRVAEAIDHYERAVRLRPDLVEAHGNLANALREAGRLPEAIGHGEIAIRLKPDSAEAHYNLGRALHEAGRAAEAMPRYEQALRLNPILAEAHSGLADALADLGRMPEALTHYEQALRLKPDSFEVNNNYGGALAQTGRGLEAVARFKAALRIDPTSAGAHFNLANLLTSLGSPNEARAHYDEALRLRPDFSAAREALNRLPALPTQTKSRN